jgi:hypothetical protein
MRFYQRGAIIVVNRHIDFANQTDLQISRSSSNAHGFNYRDLDTLAVFLLGVEQEHCKHGGPLMR